MIPEADFDPHDAFAVLKWLVVALASAVLGLCYVIKKLWEYDRQERKSMWVAISEMDVKRVEREAKIQEATAIEQTILSRCVDRLDQIWELIIGGGGKP